MNVGSKYRVKTPYNMSAIVTYMRADFVIIFLEEIF